MALNERTPLPDTTYWRHYQGAFSSLLKWEDVDAFWGQLAATEAHWYVFEKEKAAPQSPATEAQFSEILKAAEALVNARRKLSYSGAIYLDSPDAPSMIKIFDPVNMGSVCACSGERIMPKYILSLATPEAPPKKGLMARIFARADS